MKLSQKIVAAYLAFWVGMMLFTRVFQHGEIVFAVVALGFVLAPLVGWLQRRNL